MILSSPWYSPNSFHSLHDEVPKPPACLSSTCPNPLHLLCSAVPIVSSPVVAVQNNLRGGRWIAFSNCPTTRTAQHSTPRRTAIHRLEILEGERWRTKFCRKQVSYGRRRLLLRHRVIIFHTWSFSVNFLLLRTQLKAQPRSTAADVNFARPKYLINKSAINNRPEREALPLHLSCHPKIDQLLEERLRYFPAVGIWILDGVSQWVSEWDKNSPSKNNGTSTPTHSTILLLNNRKRTIRSSKPQ